MVSFKAGTNVQAATFLGAIIPDLPPGWLIEIRAKGNDGTVVQRFGSSPEIAARFGHALSRHADVWFGIGPRVRPHGGKHDVGALGTVWADVDFKHFEDGRAGASRSLLQFPLEPSVVVMSGGGFQPYWLLNEMMDPAFFDRIGNVNRGLGIALAPPGRQLDAVGDAARVLRLPGTRNFKYDPPRNVMVSLWNPKRRYGLNDLEDVVPAPPESLQRDRDSVGAAIYEGGRNAHLTSLGGSMRRRGMTEEEILVALMAVNVARCRPLLAEREVRGIAASVARYTPPAPLTTLDRRSWAKSRRFG